MGAHAARQPQGHPPGGPWPGARGPAPTLWAAVGRIVSALILFRSSANGASKCRRDPRRGAARRPPRPPAPWRRMPPRPGSGPAHLAGGRAKPVENFDSRVSKARWAGIWSVGRNIYALETARNEATNVGWQGEGMYLLV